ncbi:MAG: DNA polymerase, partial [Firmicutes bacterium]|nr:DNA polymerase [Bacillota bacterium]
AKKVQKIIEEHEKWGKDELKLITQGEIISTGQVAAISKRLGLVDLKRNTVKEALTNPNITPSARKILELREQLGKSSIKKYKVMVEAETEGRICNCIQYYGARTGRFAGRILQPHNFAKADMEITDEIYNDIANLDYKAFTFKYPNAYKILSSALRGFIKAKEGCELYVADYAAIEARVLVWLANDQEAIEAYEKGVDTYKQMAAIIYNVTPDEVTKEQRALGKAAVLGCGYGMGKVKFKSTCEAWGIPITKELAETAVNAFRERYWKVKQFWYTVQAEAIETVELRNCTRWIGETKVKFKMDKTLQFLMARLPSGRKLFYYAPKLEQKEDDEFGNRVDLTVQTMKGNEKIREKFYGGKWAENFVQAIARDLLCHSVNQLELKNFTTILHVHDEIICEEFVRDHDEMFKEFIETMKLKPEWGKGIPIDVEGYRAKRYRK